MVGNRDLYKEIIGSLYDGVYFVDQDRVITDWNKGAERISGYLSEEVIGKSLKELPLEYIDLDGTKLSLRGLPLAACMKDKKIHELAVFIHHADGHRIPVLIRANPIIDSKGTVIGAVETFSRDTGGLGIHHEGSDARHTVIKDKLTRLWNRRYLDACLRGEIAEMAPLKGLLTGLLLIDIDAFKPINDKHGNEVGDRTLQMVAATLEFNLRKNDVLGRWGGDEFLVVLRDLVTGDALKFIAEKVRMLVEYSRLDLPSKHVAVTASVAATMMLPDDNLESLLSRLEGAMIRCKKAGGNTVNLG